LVKQPNVNRQRNTFRGSRVVPRGQTGRQTDRHDEASGHFSQFCQSA